MKFGEIRKPLLIFCLSISIGIHIVAIWFLYIHPVLFTDNKVPLVIKPAPTLQVLPQEEEEMMVQKMEKALEESLNDVIAIAHNTNLLKVSSADPSVQQEEVVAVATEKKAAKTPKETREEILLTAVIEEEAFISTLPAPFDPEREESLSEFALDDELEDEEILKYESEKFASIDFSNRKLYAAPAVAEKISLFEDDYSVKEEKSSNGLISETTSHALSPCFIKSLKKLKISPLGTASKTPEEKEVFKNLQETTSPKLILPNAMEQLCNEWVKRSLADCKLPDLEYYGLKEVSTTLEWEDDIDISVTMMPDPESNKYIFSLSIQPEFQVGADCLQQNFYFVIDRSNSVEKHKFSRFKRAVQRSLAALREGDMFNIYIFDKKIVKLSGRSLAVSPKTVQMAEDFLDRQQHKAQQSAKEDFVSLEKMLPEYFDPNEIHSIILVSDGNTLLTSKQKKAMNKWVKAFDNNVHFYTAAAGKGNNLMVLDLLSYSTAGQMLYSDTNAAFPRKLVRLIKELHDPVMKNITFEISTSDQQAHVSLHPRGQVLPPMFAAQPYVVLGTVDEICDFTIFLQGKSQGKWLNIRKTISLKDAQRGGRALEKLWAQTQAKICYDQFLQNGKSSYLKEAQQIVSPYKGLISLDQ